MIDSNTTTRDVSDNDLETRPAQAFPQRTEVEFATFTRALLEELLTWEGVKNPHITTFQYDGIVTDKPSLRVTIGDAAFTLIIIKN